MSDYYELLGVRRSASVADVRRAYRKLARLLHPQLNPGDPAAAARYRAVTEAFEVLRDSHRRAAYDRGERKTKAPPPVAPVGFEGFDFSAEPRAAGPAFRELFEAVFREPLSVGGSRGEDLEARTRIAFDEVLRGAERRIQLMRHDRCPACQGAGDVATTTFPCPTCQGSGRLSARRGHMIFSRACGDCGGEGHLSRRRCARCEGEGRVMRSEWLDVRVPPGVADGARLRLPECGNAGRRGGPFGDLQLVVEVEAHPFYRRDGDDLFCTVPVTMTEAALGAHVEAPTLEGPVAIEVPAGTQTGQRFRLRKRGAPRPGGGGRGDLWVEVRVAIPAVTDARARSLLEEVARLHPDNPRKDLATAAGTGAHGRS
ncbi:MAG TPA: J domain-containing protein [Vicinamibacteria bacterium]|nr:J domain-containing protein [Vicinamibacteria bacterium]